MTTDKQSPPALQPPERIWIDSVDYYREPLGVGTYYLGKPSIASLEYVRVTDAEVAENWFDLALRYLRGDPALTDLPYSSDSVFADFLRFWDAQTPHFRSVIGSVFRAATRFSVPTAPTTTPQDEQKVIK